MSELEHDHSIEAIRERLAETPRPNYLRDWVYGGLDGAITTFAIVAGAVGAGLAPRVVVILGIASVVADGFSMAAGNYTGTKTETDELKRLRAIEHKHIEVEPDGEREELRQILKAKGLDGDILEGAVEAITSDRDRWVDTMLTEEYGLSLTPRDPVPAAIRTFVAFGLCGAVPLIPFLAGVPYAFVLASLLTAIVFAAIGSIKSQWSLARWWASALETLIIGTIAAAAAYLIGDVLARLWI